MQKKIYAGIGPRMTPYHVLNRMQNISRYLSSKGYLLRSGGALGADTAFEAGAGDLKDIFYRNDATHEAIAIASQFHPAWHNCNEYARKLLGRNVMILLGRELNDPVSLVLTWTDNAKRGGTGRTLDLAQYYKIPILNLYNIPDDSLIYKSLS